MNRSAHASPRAVLTASLAVVALALAGCTGGATDDTTPATTTSAGTSSAPTGESAGTEATVVEVSAFEFGYAVSTTEVPAGTVTFELRNDGGTDHDLVLEGGPGGSTAAIGPQETDTLTVELEPGTYTLYCSIGNHRGLGMEFEIIVS